ncbi:hypothetical protein BDV36DRAFT_254338 [Aspergillus pseudocaelatus]|uniref:Uncharacterized protein n=1 Tax=Aspergillus pseudocaelatus TaxID=1825620 RepID=A0ABQ6WMY6_9EURO|nr:hypothetical protein BDV36DRAFT_254338 [Aspergillus pseudocaelatus]
MSGMLWRCEYPLRWCFISDRGEYRSASRQSRTSKLWRAKRGSVYCSLVFFPPLSVWPQPGSEIYSQLTQSRVCLQTQEPHSSVVCILVDPA